MCGIIGILGNGPVAWPLVDALKRLEYRGYDSAGIAVLNNGAIHRRRVEGKIDRLRDLVTAKPVAGISGIGHTRWATHGAANETNAHPHATGRVAVVHNGIVENFLVLRRELEAEGCVFATETDTEAVAQLITRNLETGMEPVSATHAALKRLEGAFALAILFAGEPDLMIGARRGSPLAFGPGEGEMFLGSDALALAPFTDRIAFLEEGDWAVFSRNRADVRDAEGRPVERPMRRNRLAGAMIGKGNYRHYMQKEIHEQPAVIGDTLRALFNPLTRMVALPELGIDLASIPRVTAAACGTAYYAGLVGKYWLESLARLPVDLDIASELRYREPPLERGGLALQISQSGETIDTLEALRYARRQGLHALSIVNVSESAIARESDTVIHTLAGPEIGVASTKAFTTQLVVLAALSIAAALARGAIDAAEASRLTEALLEVPSRTADILEQDDGIKALAHRIAAARDVLYIGRGPSYAIALEGALKLEELSYIHAAGHAAGELKHGPIALIDEDVPVVAIAPSDRLFDKTASNIRQVAARGGRVILMSDAAGIEAVGGAVEAAVQMPEVDPFVAPILYAVPVQLLAYHTAVAKGTDVDQPRNLAKSVTVE
ncbi:MAG: glutamine--fructose-6-phosphate transaminase (isomerizing) [Alphaproteobacteria bacterium]|nr:glutamine--fructose-6-phosphate transaminase (isomerizing) [Alphaproteobacteria bacterium]MCY4317782.1 glutamine--fructose-6-phosphate transaminase (isomerizing) [Alphaproteobacteria bacterium]